MIEQGSVPPHGPNGTAKLDIWIAFALHAVTKHWLISNCAILFLLVSVARIFSLAEAGCVLVMVAILLAVLFQRAQFIGRQAANYRSSKTQELFDTCSTELKESLGRQPELGEVTACVNEKINDINNRFAWVNPVMAKLWTWELFAALTGTFLWGFGERIWTYFFCQ